MTEVRIRIEGQTWISLEGICECYECDMSWLREAYEFGLLGGGRIHGGHLMLRITVLDRVARVLRMSRYEGLGFEAIVVLLGDPEEEAEVFIR
jgi:hypothetical protein